MNVLNKKTPFLITICLLLSLMNSYGQELLPKEQERDIKTSGRYYYSECSAFDVADAKECALRDLTQIVIIDMIKQSIKSDDIEMKNAMEMRAQTAALNQTGKIRILAWIEKDKVQEDSEPTQTSEPTVDVEQISTTTTIAETRTEIETVPAPVSTPHSTQISTEAETVPEPELATKPDISTNPLVRDLATCETFEQFRRMADGLRRQGKIVYGTNKIAFTNLENCMVAVFTSEQKLIALLDKGQNSRIDFLTGKTVQDLEKQFVGNVFYWVQTIN